MRTIKISWTWLAATLAVTASPAQAVQLDFFGVETTINTRFSVGAAWRAQARNRSLVAKIANDNDLCEADDCMSFDGDPAPNQRLVDAEGAFSGQNFDDGNFNYDHGDLVAATALIAPDISMYWKGFTLNATAHMFYDPANVAFDTFHADDRFQPQSVPRRARFENEFAANAEFRKLNVQRYFDLFGREFSVKVGRQVINWGESNLVIFNSINEINPLDGVVFGFPGFEISDVFLPVGLAAVQTSLTDLLSLELIYQYDWEPVRTPPPGSFLSTNDVARGGEVFGISLGQFSDDPEQIYTPPGTAGLISSSDRTANVLAEPAGFPDDGGQYGAKLSYYADWLNNGTEFGLYFFNYHSRFPYFGTFEADRSCIRDAINNDIASAFVACNGFNGAVNPIGDEPLPIGSVVARLDYPEDIQMYGLSFNTNIGDWAFSGEVNYRPNLPLQVHITDVIFAGLQQAFPEEDIDIGTGTVLPDALTDLLSPVLDPLPVGTNITIPGARNVAPSQLIDFRGIDPQSGDFIEGFERFGVGQFAFTGLRILSQNPLGADQILFFGEAGGHYIEDLPDTDVLALQGSGDFTHPSPGADGTGAPDGEPDARRINPTQQVTGLPTEFAWGIRSLARLTYNEVLPGITFEPTAVVTWDVSGYSPSPLFNFIEGRKTILLSNALKIGQRWTVGASYQWYTGGGKHHLERDRDFVNVFAAIQF